MKKAYSVLITLIAFALLGYIIASPKDSAVRSPVVRATAAPARALIQTGGTEQGTLSRLLASDAEEESTAAPKPTKAPTKARTQAPTKKPTKKPTKTTTAAPTSTPAKSRIRTPGKVVVKAAVATATKKVTPKPTKAPTKRAATKAPTRKPAANTYILNTNTKKFHYPSCHSVNQMKEKNKRVFTGTRQQVINMGYVPCQNCNP